MLPPALLGQFDDLLLGMMVLARGRAERMAALTIGVSPALDGDEVRRVVRARLVSYGLPHVELHILPTSGLPRLVSVEYTTD
jgi:hypothetical protein